MANAAITEKILDKGLDASMAVYFGDEASETDRNAMRAAIEAVLPDLLALQFTPEELHHLATRHDACSICREIRQRLAKLRQPEEDR